MISRIEYFLSSLANHLGWQAAYRFKIFLEPTRRDAGLGSLQPVFLKIFSREDERSGTRSSLSIIPRKVQEREAG